MPEVWGIDYTTPIVNGPYYVSRGDVPTCGAPLEPDGYQGNAFYCGFEDTVQWDAEGLMAPLYEQFGDFTVALVLAHEWGHAIQERFGFDDSANPTIVSELQADCLAGAWTGFVASGESDILVLEPGDLEEAMSGFILIGDHLGTVPQGEGAHGLSFDRLNAFFDGYDLGTTRCAEYETVPRDEIVVSSQIGLDLLAQGEDVNLPYDQTATLLIEASRRSGTSCTRMCSVGNGCRWLRWSPTTPMARSRLVAGSSPRWPSSMPSTAPSRTTWPGTT
jgi:hypothetical protein